MPIADPFVEKVLDLGRMISGSQEKFLAPLRGQRLGAKEATHFIGTAEDIPWIVRMERKEEKLKFSAFGILLGIVAGLVFLVSPPALADKASVAIEAPENAAQGSEITIRVTVTHSANSARHHVEWVKIWANNQELAKWEFTPSNLPEGVPFTRDVKYKVGEKAEIKAEASCNIHGSKGPATLQVTIK